MMNKTSKNTASKAKSYGKLYRKFLMLYVKVYSLVVHIKKISCMCAGSPFKTF